MSRIDFPEARVGIHSIDHFALEVPDLDRAAHFLGAFGLRLERQPQQLLLRAAGSDHVWGRVLQGGDRKRLAYISVRCHPEDWPTMINQIVGAGGSAADAHAAAPSGGYWFHDPHGLTVQLLAGDKLMVDHKAALPDLTVPANVRGAPARSRAARAVPGRLSHLALFTPDATASLAFHTAALGVRLADRSGDIIAFTYGRHGSDHHLLAFLQGEGTGLHHSSWDVPSPDDVGLGNTQMRAAGYTHHWGPGRHVLGSNYFNYVRDDFGQWWEHSCHIDYIEKDAPWEMANFADEDSLYLWGPDVPEAFTRNDEPQTSTVAP
jgi:catechol 2,3-dioxygenase-like lactoylglutathione lyase family enzyme